MSLPLPLEHHSLLEVISRMALSDTIIQFTTLLFVGAVEKKIERLRVHNFIFSAGCKYYNF
jgi:hypothetical protein